MSEVRDITESKSSQTVCFSDPAGQQITCIDKASPATKLESLEDDLCRQIALWKPKSKRWQQGYFAARHAIMQELMR